MALNSISGNPDNAGIESMRNTLFSHEPGKIAISNRNSERASSIVITDDGVFISNLISSGGVTVSNDGFSTQGVVANTGKGENIIKGEYSENPKSAKIFTYQETTLIESIPKEVAAEIAGKKLGVQTSVSIAGTNQSVGMDGAFPIVTDIAPGPAPHVHTITMKHVHRIEPAYLYRVPSILSILTGTLDQLNSFFSA